MANLIAHSALLAWPVVTLLLMLLLPVQRAIVWSLLAGYLLLPVNVGFNLPVVPTLDKTSIPNLAAFVMALLLGRGGRFRWPRSMVLNLLIAGYVLGPILTGYFNRDPIVMGSMVIPAMSLYSSLSMSASNAINLLPFLLGVSMLRDESSHRDLIKLFMLAGLVYTVPVLAEIRLSPFLQGRIYGVGSGLYFAQQVRDGGFRSMVFLGHGLLVSAFLAQALLAAIGLWREKMRVFGVSVGLCVIWLALVLLLNKSLGAVLMGTVLGLALLLFRPRRILLLGFAIGAFVITFPMLRANGLVPINAITSIARSFSPDRAESLDFRLRNEDLLLQRAQERPLFGWGAYSRNRIFVVSWNGAARDVSITDGSWIIALGVSGWLGYLSLFGLLCYPFWNMFRQRKRGIAFASAALAMMLALNLLDLIPNSSLRPMTWLIAGALSGFMIVSSRAGRAGLMQQATPEQPPKIAAT